jgi:hypothetical protein
LFSSSTFFAFSSEFFGVEVSEEEELDKDDERPFESSDFCVVFVRRPLVDDVVLVQVLLQSSFKAKRGFGPTDDLSTSLLSESTSSLSTLTSASTLDLRCFQVVVEQRRKSKGDVFLESFFVVEK